MRTCALLLFRTSGFVVHISIAAVQQHLHVMMLVYTPAIACYKWYGMPDSSGCAIRMTQELRMHVAAQVSGMTCSSCSSAVESALDAVPGVGNAVVSLVQQQARVEYDTTAVTPVRPSSTTQASQWVQLHPSVLMLLMDRWGPIQRYVGARPSEGLC